MIAQKLTIATVMSINKRYRIALTGLSFLVSILSLWSQNLDTTQKIEVQKNIEASTLPDFRFFTAADSVLFTSAQLDPNKPILFFYFSTKCPYCQEMTQEITQSIDFLRDIQILMVSGHRRQSIIKYIDTFNLKNFPIIVLKDDEKRMHDYFDYAAVPMLRLYDKKRKLIHRQEGKMPIKDILVLFKKHI